MMKQTKLSLAAEVEELRREVDRLRAATKRAENDASRRFDHIKIFKAERAALDKEIAELRGYLLRVLEDDKVREAKDLPPEPGPITHNMMEEARDVLRQADLMQNQCYRPVRTGPGSAKMPIMKSQRRGLYDYADCPRDEPMPWQDRE